MYIFISKFYGIFFKAVITNLWGIVAHWLEHWTHDHKVVVLASPEWSSFVESLSKTLNPHCSSPTKVKKEMGAGKLSCWEGKTDLIVQEE